MEESNKSHRGIRIKKQGINNKKVYFLFFYFFLIFDGWNIKFLHIFQGDIQLVIEYLYLIIGYMYWFSNKKNLLSKKNLYYFYYIMGGIILSMIPAALYHNQSIFISITTYRVQYLWLSLPLLLKIAPKPSEIMKACMMNLACMWFAYICKLLLPGLIEAPEVETFIPEKDNKYDVGYVSGMTMAIFPLYYYLGRIKKKFNKNDCICFGASLLFLIAMSNRSNLFSAIALIGLSIISINSKKRYSIIFACIALAIIGYQLTASYWIELVNESTENLGSDDYNRNKALLYFIFQGSEYPLTWILGNGFLSSRCSSLVEELKDMGIYNSDMGFIGFWNQFGIIPIIAFIMIPVYALTNSKISTYIKLLGAHTLICAYSTSYYGNVQCSITFILIYYLLTYERHFYRKKGLTFKTITSRFRHTSVTTTHKKIKSK